MTKPTVSKHWRKPVGRQRSGLNPTRTTPPCYNNTTLGNRLYAQRKGPNVINPICLTCKNCSYKCAVDCEHWTLCHTMQHTAVLIIFPLNLQTINITWMLSSGGEGTCPLKSLLPIDTKLISLPDIVVDRLRFYCDSSPILLFFYLSATLQARWMELNQSWPHARKWVHFQKACLKSGVYLPQKLWTRKSPFFGDFVT